MAARYDDQDEGMTVRLTMEIGPGGIAQIRGETSTNATVEPLKWLIEQAMDQVALAAQHAVEAVK